MTTGKKYRLFLEKRLHENIDSLSVAEEALKTFQEEHRTVALDIELQSVIEAIAQLKGQIILLEVQKAAVGSPGGTSNLYGTNIDRQLRALKKQLAKIELGDTTNVTKEFGAGFAVPFSRLPEVALEYARLLRNVKVQEAIYEILTQQYEQAKIMEVKDTPTVQFLDRASPPEKRSFPRRKLIVLLAAFFSSIFSIIFIFTLEYLHNVKQNTVLYNKWQYIASELKRDYKSIKANIKKWRKKS
jgi:tyrosine-protein kinase Etk/Wzc